MTYNKRLGIQRSSYGTSKRFCGIPGSNYGTPRGVTGIPRIDSGIPKSFCVTSMQYQETFIEYKDGRWKIRSTKKLSWNTNKPLWNTLGPAWDTKKLDHKEAITGQEALMEYQPEIM